MNDNERRLWILNDEGLYCWWKSTRLSLKSFIRKFRGEITEAIEQVVRRRKPAHYLRYGG